MVFEELDPGLFDYLWLEYQGIHGNLLGFLKMVYPIQCNTAMNELFSVDLDELDYDIIPDFELTLRTFIIRCIVLEILFWRMFYVSDLMANLISKHLMLSILSYVMIF
jgi:hypothetical protein